jgi:adenylosuccinate lyase
MNLLLESLKNKSILHSYTNMIGRTHGQQAQPTTFGLVLAGHYAELERSKIRFLSAKSEINAAKIAGAVGSYNNISSEIEDEVLYDLGLEKEVVPTQIVARDRYAALFCSIGLIAAAIERLATNIRGLQRSEIGELQESFSNGQTGSSAMPHKKNPIISENLCGLSRIVRSSITPALEDIVLWHERDISHSSVERILLPDITTLIAYMLEKTKILIDDLYVNQNKMTKNLEEGYHLIVSEQIMLDLIKSGMTKFDAYKKVQQSDILNELKKVQSIDELKLKNNVDKILKRIF